MITNYGPPQMSDPATRCIAVTPSDTETLPIDSRALICNVEGRVRFTTVEGDIAELILTPGGAMPVRARKIWATGTTADEIYLLA